MNRRTILQAMAGAAALHLTAHAATTHAADEAPPAGLYQLRIYHAFEGKLDAIVARFRDHTMALFAQHGIRSVGYWLPTDEPLKGKTLIYMVAHKDRETADANWKAFHDDPEWVKVSTASEANGKLVEKIESIFMLPTDFSPHV